MLVPPSPKVHDHEFTTPGLAVDPSKKLVVGQFEPKVHWKPALQVGGVMQLIASVSQNVLVQLSLVAMVKQTK